MDSCANCNSTNIVIKKTLMFELDFSNDNELLGYDRKNIAHKIEKSGQLWYELTNRFLRLNSTDCKCINKICLDCGYKESLEDKDNIYFKNIQGI